jgi:hypothetical protein
MHFPLGVSSKAKKIKKPGGCGWAAGYTQQTTPPVLRDLFFLYIYIFFRPLVSLFQGIE